MKIKVGKITKEQNLIMAKAVRRELDIANNRNVNRHRVFKSKKDYNRKKYKKVLVD